MTRAPRRHWTSAEMDELRRRYATELGKTLVDTARVEVDFLRATDGVHSPFIEPEKNKALPNGITGILQHKMKG